MRILVVHRFFWPDQVPCAVIMRAVASHLVDDGHEVDVLSSQPSSPRGRSVGKRPRVEFLNGVRVFRALLPAESGRSLWRILNALHLGLRILLRSMLRRYDVIVVTTIPPILGGFFSALAAKITRSKLVYFCMDLHPEVGRVSGDFANPVLFAMLQRMDDWTCRQASTVLVHSVDMRDTLLSRPRAAEYTVQIMNNFALPAETSTADPIDFGFSDYRLTLIYAGNVGRFQGLETVVEAMVLLAERKDIALVIMGDGVAKSELMTKAQQFNANVVFLPYQTVGAAKLAIQQADIGLVTLIPNMYRYAYPSKTMAYLEQGRPMIAAVEPESELSRAMQSEGYGFSVPIGDAPAMADLLKRLADDTSWKATMNASALRAFERNFAPEVVLNQWSRVVDAASSP